MEIQYVGESVFAGQLGHFMALLAFITSILCCLSFFFSSKHIPKISLNKVFKGFGIVLGVVIVYNLILLVINDFKWTLLEDYSMLSYYYGIVLFLFIFLVYKLLLNLSESQDENRNIWYKIGIWSYALHVISALSVVGILFYLINDHHFEYQYVYKHTSKDLPLYYQLSSFWEGQEGSFLLWIFWQLILGVILCIKRTEWTREVMSVFCLIQVFLTSMVIGIYIGDYHIGNSPFLLFREAVPDMPLFSRADYLSFMTDGNGLNPLLQNYWMIIHPPTLFLGFSLLSVPFAYVIAGFWKNSFKDWVNNVIPWAIAGGMVLGAGILMGATWAYEALSFGGYWAWDPVENASLVPWILLMAGMHTLFIFRSTGRALRSSLIFLILAFLLILYSTFLTRSGVLGDASVHSFTGEGMLIQLVLLLMIFSFFSLFILFSKWRSLEELNEEEESSSREFWMYIGSVVLLMSAMHIILYTSIPVINKLFPTSFAPPVDAVSHYNKWQIAFGILIGGLTAFGLHLKYKRTNWSAIKRPFILIALFSLIICAFLNWVLPMQWVQLTFLLVLIFSALSNLTYMLIKTKRLSNSGAAMAHLGFALLMIGILLSAGKSDVISLNKLGIKYGETYDDKANYENILLYKDMPMAMGDYTITYLGDSVVGLNHYYKVDYHNDKENFRLYPYVQNNPKFGRSANPDTRHYWNRDIFTHVTSVSNTELNKEKVVSNEHQVKIGDSVFTASSCIIIESVEAVSKHKMLIKGDIALKAKAKVLTLQDTFHLEPICAIRTNQWVNFPDTLTLKSIGLELAFIKLDPEKDLLSLKTTEWDPPKDFIIMKAIVFPYINVLWLGSIVMIFGFGISLYKRIKKA